MRTTIAILSLCAAVAAYGADTAGMTPDALLQRGTASYRARQYADAVTDLSAAAAALLSQEQMQNYVNTGKFPDIDKFETAIVYLTLAQAKLGHNDQAREAVLRLMTAERIEPTYAQLPLTAEVAEFEALAARMVPASTLPPNIQLAGGTAAVLAPPTLVADAAPTKPATTTATMPPAPVSATSPTTTTRQPPPVTTASAAPRPEPPVSSTPVKTATVAEARPSSPAPTPVQAPPPQPKPAQTAAANNAAAEARLATERADRQRVIDELVAQERAKIQKAADDRIAEERAVVQKSADERIAAERASMQRAADERVAQARAAAEAAASVLSVQKRRVYLQTLRQADEYAADRSTTPRAGDLYTSIVNSKDAPREIALEAAVGLYRTGAFRNAASAFQRLAPYARGEEDLRYYNAVALYETGNYSDAKRELACALPFIQVTDDVTRYQTKIERTPSQQAAR